MFGRVNPVNSAPQHAQHAPTGSQRSLVGHRINATRQSADHRNTVAGQAGRNLFGRLAAIDCDAAAAHYGNRPLIGIKQLAQHVKDRGRLVDLHQPLGIIRVFPGKNLDSLDLDTFPEQLQIQAGPQLDQVLNDASAQPCRSQIIFPCLPGCFNIAKGSDQRS